MLPEEADELGLNYSPGVPAAKHSNTFKGKPSPQNCHCITVHDSNGNEENTVFLAFFPFVGIDGHLAIALL